MLKVDVLETLPRRTLSCWGSDRALQYMYVSRIELLEDIVEEMRGYDGISGTLHNKVDAIMAKM